MEMISIVGIAIVSTLICVVLKQYKPEFSLAVSLIAGAVILIYVIGNITPILDLTSSLFEATQMPEEYISIVFKALGICFITQIASDTCMDAGHSAIASKVELAGKIAVLLMALPLFERFLEITTSLIRS